MNDFDTQRQADEFDGSSFETHDFVRFGAIFHVELSWLDDGSQSATVQITRHDIGTMEDRFGGYHAIAEARAHCRAVMDYALDPNAPTLEERWAEDAEREQHERMHGEDRTYDAAHIY